MYAPGSREELSQILQALEIFSRQENMPQVGEALSDARFYLAMAEGRIGRNQPLFQPPTDAPLL